MIKGNNRENITHNISVKSNKVKWESRKNRPHCHIVNFLLGRYSLLAAATQMTYAIFAGVFLSACMLRNNSIWPVIIIHSLVNASGSLNEITVGGSYGQFYETTLADSLSSLAIFLLLFVYSMFILRKVKPINQFSNDACRTKIIPSTVETN